MRIHQFSNLIFICIAVVFGIAIPQFGSYIQPLVTPLVMFLVYTLFRDIQPREVTNISIIKLVFIAGIISYVILPLFGSQVLKLILPEKIFIGFVILISSPTTAVSAVWTRIANGDVQLATAVTIGSVIISPIVTPLIFTYLIRTQSTVPVFGIFIELMIVIIGGILFTIVVPNSIVSEQTINYGSILSLLLIIYSTTTQVKITTIDLIDVLAICSVAVILLIFGFIVITVIRWFLSISQPQSIALFYSVNMKNLGISLLISNFTYSDPYTTITILICFLFQQLIVALISDYIS